MRNIRSIIILTCILALIPVILPASEFESKKDLHISNLHQIDDDLYVFGEKLQMDGSVSGDLLVFCYDARMAGTVAGSANFFARSVRQSGTVLHSLRTFSESALIEGNISGSYLGIGSRIDVAKGAVIERDLTMYAADGDMEGLVKGNADFKGARITIAGTIEGDVHIRSEKISIIPPAVIRGKLVYESNDSTVLDTMSGVILAGGVTWEKPKLEDKKDEESNYVRPVAIWAAGFLAAFVFGIILVTVFRPYTAASVDQLVRRTSVAFATGLLSLGVMIAALIVLLVGTFTLIAGAVMVDGSAKIVGTIVLLFGSLLVPTSGFVALAGVVAFYTAKIIVGFVVGTLILRQAQGASGQMSKTSLLVGLAILTLLSAIPYVGWLFCVAIALLGVGALVLGVRMCRAQMPELVDSATAETIPPPAS